MLLLLRSLALVQGGGCPLPADVASGSPSETKRSLKQENEWTDAAAAPAAPAHATTTRHTRPVAKSAAISTQFATSYGPARMAISVRKMLAQCAIPRAKCACAIPFAELQLVRIRCFFYSRPGFPIRCARITPGSEQSAWIKRVGSRFTFSQRLVARPSPSLFRELSASEGLFISFRSSFRCCHRDSLPTLVARP
jgi:hypothetical protein